MISKNFIYFRAVKYQQQTLPDYSKQHSGQWIFLLLLFSKSSRANRLLFSQPHPFSLQGSFVQAAQFLLIQSLRYLSIPSDQTALHNERNTKMTARGSRHFWMCKEYGQYDSTRYTDQCFHQHIQALHGFSIYISIRNHKQK